MSLLEDRLNKDLMIRNWIKPLVQEREQARHDRDYDKADRIRNLLGAYGVIIGDQRNSLPPTVTIESINPYQKKTQLMLDIWWIIHCPDFYYDGICYAIKTMNIRGYSPEPNFSLIRYLRRSSAWKAINKITDILDEKEFNQRSSKTRQEICGDPKDKMKRHIQENKCEYPMKCPYHGWPEHVKARDGQWSVVIEELVREGFDDKDPKI